MKLNASRDVDLLGEVRREVTLAAGTFPGASLAARTSPASSFAIAFGPDYMQGMTYFSLDGWLRDGVGRELVFTRESEAVHPATGETVPVDEPIFMTFYEEAGGGDE